MVIMRYPEGHKEAIRERIVAAAATALREQGLSGVSIPALTKSVGLTHGGFYAHFESRGELVAAAVEAAATQTAREVFWDGVPLVDAFASISLGATSRTRGRGASRRRSARTAAARERRCGERSQTSRRASCASSVTASFIRGADATGRRR